MGDNVSRLLQLPGGLSMERVRKRRSLSRQIESVERNLDQQGNMAALDTFGQRAYDLLLGTRPKRHGMSRVNRKR